MVRMCLSIYSNFVLIDPNMIQSAMILQKIKKYLESNSFIKNNLMRIKIETSK